MKHNLYQTFCNQPVQCCELWEVHNPPAVYLEITTEMIQGELTLFVSDSSVWGDQKLL